MELLYATYHLDAGPAEAEVHARSVLLEQTIETPEGVAQRYPFVRDQMQGQIETLAPAVGGGYRLVLGLPIHTAAVDPAQFLNVLFGNASLHAHLTLEDVTLPPALHARFPGPRFGIDGLRALTGVTGRPLTCSALKPVGLRLDELATLCRLFAEGGIDLIKDDHYLADHPFCPFEDRVRRCQDTVEETAARTGHRAHYVPNLSGTPDQVHRQLDFARAAGVRVVMAAPMLLGLPCFYELVRRHPDVAVLAHPSFGGMPNIRPALLLGKLFRLYGADAVIFANYGGRFSYPQAVCADIAATLRAPWAAVRPAFPVPAGGMQVERTREIVSFFGLDTILLIGGSLLEAGPHLLDRTRELTDRVARAVAEITTSPS